MISTYVIVALVAYLLGSLPSGYILVRYFFKQDTLQADSGNVGATNGSRKGHTSLAIATLLLDAGKGALAIVLNLVLFMHWIWEVYPIGMGHRIFTLSYVSAVAAVVGDMFPIWLKFRGGKGVATAAGAFAILAPEAILVAFAVFVLVTVLTRYVSIGSISAAAALPVAVYWFPPEELRDVGPSILFGSRLSESPIGFWAAIIAGTALIILKHHANIRRLLAGTEKKLGA